MRKQLSIVLVEGDHVPRELSALLVGMGVWVKSTWSTGLAAALEQTSPHLVVCGDPSQLPLLKRAISETHPGTPLLLIGDWDLKRASRAVASGLVEDLIPESLPAADIARRLETLAARRASRSPSRATLTPPTRAGIHPLLPVGAGRDDRTPESRQDPPAPSRRPPPPPVRVMSHGPSQPPQRLSDVRLSSGPPPAFASQAMPEIPRQARLPSVMPTLGFGAVQPTFERPNQPPASVPPPPPVRSVATGQTMRPPSAHPPAMHHSPSAHPPAMHRSPSAHPPAMQPQALQQPHPYYDALPRSSPPQAPSARSYPPQSSPPPSQSRAPQSYPPRSIAPYSVAPYSVAPDSAPPIQMVTRTTASRRRRKSGPGFTLGAALGVAASAAAFVGVIEFERDLRVLATESAGRLGHLIGGPRGQLPSWLASVAGHVIPKSAEIARPAAPTSTPAALPAPPATSVPLELSDLGDLETDGALGMSLSDAAALFQVQDTRLPGCDELLADWEPPLPMIEEDRPKHAAAHRRQAQEQLVAGEPRKALHDLCKSARIDPAGPGTETLASVYLSLRSLEHAETWARRFLADNPRSDSGRELLGDIQNQRGKVAEARAVWLEVLGVDRDASGLLREVAKHWVQDATSALGARDLAQGERKLRRALTLDPKNASAALLLARLLERQGDTDASIAWSKRAQELSER